MGGGRLHAAMSLGMLYVMVEVEFNQAYKLQADFEFCKYTSWHLSVRRIRVNEDGYTLGWTLSQVI